MARVLKILVEFFLSLFAPRVPQEKKEFTPEDLLQGIRQVEANGNYNAYYSNARNVQKPKFTSMSFREVLEWQDQFVRNGKPSSAVGAYQFIRATLREFVPIAGLKFTDKFSEENQDLLAVKLLERRGYNSYRDGSLSATEFGNRLAREWASFPVMNKQQGAYRVVKRGQSYYAGDKLNKALVSPEEVLVWIKKVK